MTATPSSLDAWNGHSGCTWVDLQTVRDGWIIRARASWVPGLAPTRITDKAAKRRAIRGTPLKVVRINSTMGAPLRKHGIVTGA